jgi:two-component system, OmpR family, KDP operon response regulator KdpE
MELAELAELAALVVPRIATPQLRAALDAAPFRVTIAARDAAALRATCDECPDVIFIDGDEAGATTLGLVRMLWAACDSPVLVFRADASPEAAIQLLDAGADDVIPKSCEEPELSARVRAALRRHVRYEERLTRTLRSG